MVDYKNGDLAIQYEYENEYECFLLSVRFFCSHTSFHSQPSTVSFSMPPRDIPDDDVSDDDNVTRIHCAPDSVRLFDIHWIFTRAGNSRFFGKVFFRFLGF